LIETFQEQLNTRLESLKFGNVEDERDSFRTIVCIVENDVLGKKELKAARIFVKIRYVYFRGGETV